MANRSRLADEDFEDEPRTIVVRDLRTPESYLIENVVMDDWYGVIGPVGYGLYGLLVRLRSKETLYSYPGYTLITAHLRVDKSTVSRYCWLLEECGLILREKLPGQSVNYWILSAPSVTPETLARLKKAIEEKKDLGEYLQTSWLQWLDEWGSLTRWFNHSRRRTNLNPVQRSLFEGGNGTEAAVTPTVMPSANGNGKAMAAMPMAATEPAEVPETAAVGLLREVGITKRAVLVEFAGLDVVLVQATIWRAQVDPATQSLTGRVITDLREDYPTAGFVDFARFWWEELDGDGRKDFLDWINGRLIDISGLVNDWELNRAAAEAGLAVVKFWKGLT